MLEYMGAEITSIVKGVLSVIKENDPRLVVIGVITSIAGNKNLRIIAVALCN